MTTESKASTRKVLADIAADMARDAKEFDGKPLTGRVLAEYMGNHGAAIAALAGIVAGLLPPDEKPPITIERLDEIVAQLNGFRVYEYEGGTDLVNGRAVPVRTVVGCDFNIEQAIEWALTQPEVSTSWCDDDGRSGDIELTDGTSIEWITDEKQWSVTVSDPKHWPPLPGDVWHLLPKQFEDGTCLPVEAWHAIACRDYTGGAKEVDVQMTQPSVPDCDWQAPDHVLSFGEMKLVYREGVTA